MTPLKALVALLLVAQTLLVALTINYEAGREQDAAERAASEVAMEAVQLFGGNGYMAEFRVEQLARDAKVLQIYAGTDEIQTVAIARGLLA